MTLTRRNPGAEATGGLQPTSLNPWQHGTVTDGRWQVRELYVDDASTPRESFGASDINAVRPCNHSFTVAIPLALR